MKVLHLISGGDVGGAKTHVLTLLCGLACEAEMICFREGPFAEEARQRGIATRVLEGRNLFKTLKALQDIVREERTDIIHCHGSRGNLMGALLKFFLKIPVITTVHSDYRLDYLGRFLARITYGAINKLALKYIDYRIGVSDAMARLLISRGFSPDTVFTIYNGIDCTPRQARDRESFFADFGIELPPNSVVAGIAARLDPVKDIATLIRAAALAAGACPNLVLAIAGAGAELENLKALAAELKIADRVHFLGWVGDIDSFYNAIDINMLTSLYETFPYALTEGGRAGLPTVATEVGGIPGLIRHGITGLLFPPGDSEALAAHMKSLCASPERRQTLGENLKKTVREKFSLDMTWRTQEDIYDTVLRRYARKNKRGRDGVTICGSYGHGNAGDEAILSAIIRDLQAHDPDMPLCVLSRKPKQTRIEHRVSSVYSFNIPGFLKKMKKSKLYISGGGSLIQNATSRRSLWYYLFNISAAARMGSPVMMYGCGIGPVRGRFDRALVCRVLNKRVDGITLRDGVSKDELSRIGVKKPEIVLSADPALTLTAAQPEVIDGRLSESGIPLDGRYVCFALRDWPGFSEKTEAFVKAAEYAYKQHGLTPVFLSINPSEDEWAGKKVREKLTIPSYTIASVGDYGEILGVLSRMRLVVAMRLHGLIFAASQGVPLIGVVYDPKVRSFLEYMGQDMYAELPEVSPEALEGLTERAMDVSEEKLRARHQELLVLQRENMKMAKRLLGG